jgi:hypothetical protein
MIKTIALNIIEIENLEKKLSLVLALGIVLCLCGYIYLINDSIFQVAVRKETEEKIATVETDITALVSTYMAISSTINMDKATALGFTEAGNSAKFVSRHGGSGLTLSFSE